MEYKILVAEDDREIREGISIYLRNQGYRVLEAENGREALNIACGETVHLAVIDLMMPVMDGSELIMRLRRQFDFPVIILSAKSEDIDKITGLNIGADDYMTKPFVPMELVARVNSQIRRYGKYLEALKGAGTETGNVYTIGGLELSEDTVELTSDGVPVKLTPLEYKIIRLLMKNPGRVFSAEEIYEKVWNERAVNTDTVMVHIRNIREKIEIDPKKPKYLKVVWGIGYKIEKQ